MKGKPIVVEYQGEPRSLREVGLMIGVSARAMCNRWHEGKRGAELFAPADERMRRRGRWDTWALYPHEYNTWRNMIQRCENPKSHNYYLYGGRGIRVSARWHDLDCFLADMGPRPTPQHSLDRYPDKEGNYEPGNCRWATSREQNRNRSNNTILSFNGRTMTLVEWAEAAGINPRTLSDRLLRGWSIERALTTQKVGDVVEAPSV